MNHASLFSGIGGFDLAAEWSGWNNVFHCEIDEFCQKVLAYHFPNSEQFTDITQSDFSKYANRIDILTGGFPCQPFSVAGKREGSKDSRYLWKEMFRVIQCVKPTWVIAENVYGIVSIENGMVFETVQTDLESKGYEVQPVIIPACSVNAPHKRNRIWFVAHSNNKGRSGEFREIQKENGEISKRYNNAEPCNSSDEPVTNSNSIGQEFGEKGECSERRTQSNDKQFERCSKLHRGNFEMFPSQSPICGGNDGISERLDSITFSKWRKESIKAYGNAIVPQVAYQIFQSINDLQQ